MSSTFGRAAATTTLDGGKTAPTTSRPAWPPTAPVRALSAAAASGIAFGTAWIFRDQGLLVLAPLVVAWVLVPTAERLDRRLAINISATFGFGAFLSCLPTAGTAAGGVPVSRGAILLSLVAGLSAWWVGGTKRRHVLPRMAPSDAFIPAVAAAAAFATSPMASPGSPENAFASLTEVRGTSGWDNASHFSMFLTQRQSGVAPSIEHLLGVDGVQYFGHYPQQFHGVLATLAGLLWGEAPGPVAVELIRYTQLEMVVFVMVATVATAMVLQRLPRSSPFAAGSAAVGVAGLIVGFPGVTNLVQGHLSFLFACTAAAAIPLLCPASRIQRTPGLILLWAALFVLSAQWPLLLPLALAGSWRMLWWVVTTPGRGRTARLSIIVLTAGLTAYTCGALLRPATSVAGQLVATGEVAVIPVPVLLGAPLLVVVLMWRQLGASPDDEGVRDVLVAALTALTTIVALGVFQLTSSGELTYYFWKLGMGSVLVVLLCALPVLARALGQFAYRPGARRPLREVAAPVAALAVSALGLACFAGPPSAAVPVQTRSALLAAQGGSPTTALLLETSLATSPDQAGRTTLIWADPRRDPILSSQWFHTLTSSRSTAADLGDSRLGAADGTNVENLEAAAMAAVKEPGQVVVTNDRAVCAAIVDRGVPGAANRCRVVSAR